MKHIAKLFLILLCALPVLVSCKQDRVTESVISTDILSIIDVAAQNPADVSVALTSNVSWIVVTPDWITPSSSYGHGDAILTFMFSSNYKDETTNVAPRSGEIKISGGGTMSGKGVVVSIAVNQLGHTWIDPNPAIGCIPDAEEFAAFIKAANTGGSLARWTSDEGEIPLTADIDLSTVEIDWQAIADGTDVSNANNDCTVKNIPFSGIFNGNNHKVTGFNPTVVLDANKTFGLFATISEATIKDLELSGTMTVSAKGQADAGMLVGTALNSSVQNVKLTGKIISSGTDQSKRFSVGGICGFVCAKEDKVSVIKDCISDVVAEVTCGTNAANGATGVMYGGIAGFATTPKLSGDQSVDFSIAPYVTVEGCVNNGNMNVKVGRCSGILPTANTRTVIKSCTNYGNQVNTIANGRLGNIVCNLALSKAVDCVNYGDIDATASGYSGTVAGIAALGGEKAVIEGGANYGTVKTVSTASSKDGKYYVGLIIANFGSTASSVSNVVAGGGLVMDGVAVEINAENYMSYIGFFTDPSKVSGIIWNSSSNK